MKKILIFVIMINAVLLASSSEKSHSDKKDRINKQIELEMKKEQQYAREQTFYKGKDYDLKGAEVNLDSLSTLPDLEDDDFDMDSVYD